MTGSNPASLRRPEGDFPQRSRRRNRAFTLVEVMIATAVFTVGILGVYAMMIKSYQLVTMSRHRDNARAVLVSFADEFLRLQVSDSGTTRSLFVPSSETITGLKWTDPDGTVVNGDTYSAPTPPNPYPGLPVWLGSTGTAGQGSPIRAYVTREVRLLDAAGLPLDTSINDPSAVMVAAGYMLQATFVIRYTYNSQAQEQRLTVARSAR
jgi:prepilin-type N-terminal cleavage/methylation domain-containing protein